MAIRVAEIIARRLPGIGTTSLPQLKIALQLRSLRQPLRQALVTASRLGAHAVEIDARTELRPAELTQTALRQFRKLLDDLNLRVSALSFRTRRGYDETEALDRRVEATKEVMQMAHTLGTTLVLNCVGSVPADEENPRWKLLVEVMSDLAAHGNRVGAMLAAETGNDSPELLAKLLAVLPPGATAVSLDPAALVMHGYDPQQAVAVFGSHVQNVAARDAVRDRAASRGEEVQLGRGSVDFPALLGALEQRDYRGYFTVARDAASRPAEELGLAIQYLKNI